MPETAQDKLYHGMIDPPTAVSACPYDYAELDVTTNFSFLRGASHPDEMVYMAAMLGYRAIAITDLNSVAGVVRALALERPQKHLARTVEAVFREPGDEVAVRPVVKDRGEIMYFGAIVINIELGGETRLIFGSAAGCWSGFHTCEMSGAKCANAPEIPQAEPAARARCGRTRE